VIHLEKFKKLVEKERERQVQKWGPQTHPDVHPQATDAYDACMFSGVPTEQTTKDMNNEDVLNETVNWAGIAVEELSEAISAAGDKNMENCMTELVQVAAVCAAWYEDILTRTETK
jgi:hypothetical protein